MSDEKLDKTPQSDIGNDILVDDVVSRAGGGDDAVLFLTLDGAADLADFSAAVSHFDALDLSSVLDYDPSDEAQDLQNFVQIRIDGDGTSVYVSPDGSGDPTAADLSAGGYELLTTLPNFTAFGSDVDAFVASGQLQVDTIL